MGAGSSKQSSARKKVMAVNAFENAGARHRQKRGRKGSKKSRRKESTSRIEEPSVDDSSDMLPSPKSSWVRLREKSLPQIEYPGRSNLRLSDFNKVVRKKSLEPDDLLPPDLPYNDVYKVEPEELCHICSVYTGRETYPCRICRKVYHEGCLRKLGHCMDPASCVILKRALKPQGWSCHECDDLSNMLTEEEIFTLLDSFEKHSLTQDSSMSLEDYLTYRRNAYKHMHSVAMPTAELQKETAVFHRLDMYSTGSITWWEFLNFEAANLLIKRGKNAVARLLYPRELQLANRLFRVFDPRSTGSIAECDAKKGIAAWYTLFLETDESLNGFSIMSSKKDGELWYVLAEMLTFTLDDPKDNKRPVLWTEFVKELAIYMIAARPNLSPVPLEGSEWTKGVVVSTETDCDVKKTPL